jgi:glycosyltransferase involved in cell wall biosynthesis
MGLAVLPYVSAWLQAHRRIRDPRFRLGTDDPMCDANESVTVLIPARNEVDDIEEAVQCALAQDHPRVSVVVIDDGSTDGTPEVLAGMTDPRLRIVNGGDAALPEQWLGKPWACHRAAKEADGDWLLFVDADVRLAPEAVSRAVYYAQEQELGLLSGLGQLVNVSWGERVLQPVVTGLIIAANDLAEVNDPSRPEKALASGQFLLFRRTAYEAVGGHGAVRDNVLDDVGLARAIKAAGIGFHCVHMRTLYRCRMYASGLECWRGWRKNLFPGLERRVGMIVLIWLFFLLFLLGPVGVGLTAMLSGDPLLFVAALFPLLLMHGLRWRLDGVYGQSRIFGLTTHMLGQALFAVLVLDSAWATSHGSAIWKGRALPPHSS